MAARRREERDFLIAVNKALVTLRTLVRMEQEDAIYSTSAAREPAPQASQRRSPRSKTEQLRVPHVAQQLGA